MIEPAKKTIDGLEIQISPLPARQGNRVLYRLNKCVAPSLAHIVGMLSAGQKFDMALLDVSSLGGAISELFERCSEKDVDYFIDTLLVSAIVDNKRLLDVADVEFQGKLLTLYKVLYWAIELNYPDFFAALRALSGKQKSAQKTALTSKVD